MTRTTPILLFGAAIAGLVAGLAGGLHPRTADAATVSDAQKYQTCMTLTRSDPEKAWESALAWRDLGGGDAAAHCAAVALIGLKLYPEAATRLEDLARRMKVDASFKAKLLDQAAQAWLLGGNAKRARDVLDAALKLTPKAPGLLVDRAEALAAMQAYWDAIDDLNQALDIDPNLVDALVFRATAYRFVNAPELALADVNRALKIDPHHPEGLLERGILRRMAGNKAGARADWMTILREAPGGAAAHDAQANLEKMDVTTESKDDGGPPPKAAPAGGRK